MNVYCTKTYWDVTNGGIVRDWLADSPDGISAGFDAESNPGSTIYVISTKDLYVKNSQRQWQKAGTTEVLA